MGVLVPVGECEGVQSKLMQKIFPQDIQPLEFEQKRKTQIVNEKCKISNVPFTGNFDLDSVWAQSRHPEGLRRR